MPANIHAYRIEIFEKGGQYRTIENENASFEQVCAVLGSLCLNSAVEKMNVYRDDKLYRVIEVRSHDT